MTARPLALLAATMIAGLLAGPIAPAQAAGPGQLQRVCVVNRTNGEITHRYVLVYRSSDQGQSGTHRLPRRDYRKLWSTYCGPNGTISHPTA